MSDRETAVLAAGCFWCVEAVFEQLEGVVDVQAGYAGGKTGSPTYEEVCSGKSGHAEVACVTFDPTVITFEQLLETFWQSHDPTTLNRQGSDVGTQYRSAIFYSDESQKTIAERSKQAAQPRFGNRIVTEISPLLSFHPAETYHQDYFRRNQSAPYCQFVIRPKLEKLGLSEDRVKGREEKSVTE